MGLEAVKSSKTSGSFNVHLYLFELFAHVDNFNADSLFGFAITQIESP